MHKKRIVVLIILVLFIVMVGDFKINGGRVFENYFRQMETDSLKNINFPVDTDSPRASNKAHLKINTSTPLTLRLANKMGSVRVMGEEREDIDIKYEITVYAGNESQARDYLKSLHLESVRTEDQLEVLLKKEVEVPDYIRGIKVDYNIKVPEDIKLDIKNNYGKLTVAGIDNNVKLANYYKAIEVENIEGNADVQVRYGNLLIDNIRGKLTVDSSYNKTEIENVASDLILKSGYSEVSVDNISGSLKLDNKYGKVDVRGVSADIDAESKYSQLFFKEVKGKIDVDTKYGELNVLDPVNNLVGTGEYTDIKVKFSQEVVNHNFNCQVSNGNLNSDLSLPVKTSGNIKELNGRVGAGKIDINLETKHGDIVIDSY